MTLGMGVASAHVTVKPAEVGVGAFQTFTTDVPTEGDFATTNVRLVLPDGLHYVSPNVKTGWQVDVKKTGEGEDAKVTEITWSGGTVPVGLRDEFSFSAQAPSKVTTLQWKAYQTYADGKVVAWDQAPSADSHDEESVKPYSETKVVDDLSAPATEKQDLTAQNRANVAIVLSILALLISLSSGMLRRKK